MDAPNFMQSPLVQWVQTFSAEVVSYNELCDGVFLNEVMQQIDPKLSLDTINTKAEDARDKMQNWDVLMKHMMSYYEEVLQQYLVMKPPNTMLISHHPESEVSHAELERVLLLLLGCAVQSDQKEMFIENIKKLDVNIQHSIVDYIQQITDTSRNVFPIDVTLEQCDDLTLTLYNHLCSLLHQRKTYIQEIKTLHQTLEEVDLNELPATINADVTERSVHPPCSLNGGSAPERRHIAVELAESKAKLRKLRQELEDKSDFVLELQEELDALRLSEQKLRTERLDLMQDARSAKTYRDELDIVREKASRVDKLESEIVRYKEKLNELEFYRARVDELRQDNGVLLENHRLLEKELDTSHQRISAVIDLENDLQAYKQQIATFAEERGRDRQQIQELIETIVRLEYDKKINCGDNSCPENGLLNLHTHIEGVSGSLLDQLSETANSQILRLELENQRLKRHLDDMKETAILENASKMLELEKENNRLSKKVEMFLESSGKEELRFVELESTLQQSSREKKDLEQTIQTVKESAERQLKELGKENEQLMQKIETLRERNEKTTDLKVKDLELENKRLDESLKSYVGQVTKLDFENKQLTKNCKQLSDNLATLESLGSTNEDLTKQNRELLSTVSTLQRSCERFESLERESSHLEVENEKLLKAVESLQKLAQKKEELETLNIDLAVENQHLKRSIESAKVSELEHEKSEMDRVVQQLQKTIEVSESERVKQEQLKNEVFAKDDEIQTLRRNLDVSTRKFESLQGEFEEFEAENRKLSKSLETAKISEKKLEMVERQNRDMENENGNIIKEKLTFEKEIKKKKVPTATLR